MRQVRVQPDDPQPTAAAPPDGPDPLRTLTAGDDEAARELRANLGRIASQHADQPVARVIARVLSGEAEPSALMRSPDFMGLVRGGTRRIIAHRDAMSPEERSEWLRAEGSSED